MTPVTSIQHLLPGISANAPIAGSSSIPTAELRALNSCQPGGAAAQPADGSFSACLDRMVNEVNNKQGAATQALQDLQSGKSSSLHQAMIAVEEASVSFQFMVEVRNRLLESYQEVMRMQV
jgi:flagellar hook-basal body complex protein FliE